LALHPHERRRAGPGAGRVGVERLGAQAARLPGAQDAVPVRLLARRPHLAADRLLGADGEAAVVLHSARELDGERTLEADLCVVGTGAGGAMVAREAARAGLRVIALEEGPHSTPRDFTQREDEMLPRLFQDAGARATEDGAVTV